MYQDYSQYGFFSHHQPQPGVVPGVLPGVGLGGAEFAENKYFSQLASGRA